MTEERPARCFPDDRALQIFVIYENPRDYPGRFVVREQLVDAHLTIAPAPLAIALTLEEARAALPPGLWRFPRFPEDDPCIREVWL